MGSRVAYLQLELMDLLDRYERLRKAAAEFLKECEHETGSPARARLRAALAEDGK